MRVQNLEQMIKGLPGRDERPCVDTLIDKLRSAKWHLWHGCPYPALQRLESLGWELATDGRLVLRKIASGAGSVAGTLARSGRSRRSSAASQLSA